MPPPKQGRIWTRDVVAREAQRYETRADFMRNSRSAYNAAHRLGIIDSVSKHMRDGGIVWTPENLPAEAIKYKSRVEFQENSRGAYLAARRYGIIDQITTHMKRRGQKWFPATIAAEAKKYRTRLAFHIGSQGACQRARDLGILEEVCSHMEPNPVTDNDAVYIWKVKGSEVDGKWICKIGTTSQRLRTKRIRECAYFYGFKYELIILKKLRLQATLVESILLRKFSLHAEIPKLHGYTEFRLMSDHELKQACAWIETLAFLGE